jgi:hypothetical protein
MKSFAELDQEQNGDYLKLLSATSQLSGLFSDSAIPYLYYRAAENIFCRSFGAKNLSRSDTAFDADFNKIGVGLKTFICLSNNSVEKVAEFNTLSKTFKELKGKELAIRLAECRNERIAITERLYNTEDSVYHIVARRKKELLLFETDYKTIDIDGISAVKESDSSIQFNDGKNFYSFNFSKSTLYRRFIIPENAFHLPIDIVEDPFSLILDLFHSNKSFLPAKDLLQKGINYVILPLYGIHEKQKFVFEKSGLNQWNAGGRKRNMGEVYIPVPIEIHKKYPNFFPSRDEEFSLQIPTGEIFRAKLCQENAKALMTNPNKALSDWLLRKLFQLKEGELATYERLNLLGFDSVVISKDSDGNFSIDKSPLDSYERFIEG